MTEGGGGNRERHTKRRLPEEVQEGGRSVGAVMIITNTIPNYYYKYDSKLVSTGSRQGGGTGTRTGCAEQKAALSKNGHGQP